MSAPTGESGTTTPPAGTAEGGQHTQPNSGSTTSPAQPNTPEQTFTQADLDKAVERRLARERAKFADYETLKERAGQWDNFVAESKSDQEKAIEAARKEAEENAYGKARREFGGQLVEANIRAHAAGRLSDAALTALLAGVDKTLFLNDQGQADSTRITQFIDGIAPAKTASGTPGGFGQGPRDGNAKAGIDAGRAAWESRHPKDATPPMFT